MSSTYDIFISYPLRDREWVKRVVKALAKEGVRAWDDTQLGSEDLRADEMRDAIEISRYVLFVITDQPVNNNWRAWELGLVLGAGKPVIPVVPKNIEAVKIPGPLKSKQYLQRSEPEDMAKEIKRVVG